MQSHFILSRMSSRTYKLFRKYLPQLFVFVMLGAGNLAFAQTSYGFPNPIGSSTFADLVNNIAIAVRNIAIPFAVIAIIFVGFKFITASASGNQAELTSAKKLFVWVLIGTAIIVGASVLAQAVVNTIKSF